MTPTPKPRRMLQPVKDELRRQIAVLEAQVAYERGLPLWRRALRWWRS